MNVQPHLQPTNVRPQKPFKNFRQQQGFQNYEQQQHLRTTNAPTFEQNIYDNQQPRIRTKKNFGKFDVQNEEILQNEEGMSNNSNNAMPKDQFYKKNKKQQQFHHNQYSTPSGYHHHQQHNKIYDINQFNFGNDNEQRLKKDESGKGSYQYFEGDDEDFFNKDSKNLKNKSKFTKKTNIGLKETSKDDYSFAKPEDRKKKSEPKFTEISTIKSVNTKKDEASSSGSKIVLDPAKRKILIKIL